MRTKLRSKVTLLFMSLGMLLAVPAIALADNLHDNLTGGKPSATITQNDPNGATVQYWLEATQSNGCDASPTNPVTVGLQNLPAGVTATPNQITFDKCTDKDGTDATAKKSIKWTSSAVSPTGGFAIEDTNFYVVSGTTSMNFNNAKFTLTVNPDVTAPKVASFAPTGSSELVNTTVTATFSEAMDAATLNDAEGDGNFTLKNGTQTVAANVSYDSATKTATLTPNADLAYSTEYTATVSTGAKDLAGNALDQDSAASGNQAKTWTFTTEDAPAPADSTAPVITPDVQGTLGQNGWYTSNVSVSWTVEDNESAISSKSAACDTTTNITSDTAGQTVSCTATSGGGTDTKSVTIKRDATAPQVTLGAVSGTAGSNGWYTSDVTQTFNASDALSGVVGPASFTKTSSGEGSNVTVSSGDVFDNAGNKASNSASFKIDKTAPLISGLKSPAANFFGWNNTAVLVDYSCSDATSGVDSCGPDETLSNEGANQSSTGNATDNAGNTANTTVSGINIDLTNPLVALVGGPANGSSHYFGFVPSAPTCDASDALSGLNGACQVSGYGTTVGPHTVTATANDKAGNTNSASNSYTVLAWTLNGFKSPVDMGILNNAKGGATVPLKFNVFAGNTELTNTNVVSAFTQKVNCVAGTGDDIEQYATGSTSLRYSGTPGIDGQFIFNWQTPKQAGACYKVILETQDGSKIAADFRLK